MPLWQRFSIHILLVAIILAGLFLARTKLPLWHAAGSAHAGATPTETAVPTSPPAVPAARPADLPPYPVVLARAAVPHTIIPERPRLEIITYTVQAGDTVLGLAERFGISPETILWANGDLEYHPDDLRVGQELIILPTSGVYHEVKAGDTLGKLAAAYQVSPETIRNYPLNQTGADDTLVVGQKLIIPDGVKPYVPRRLHRFDVPLPANAPKGSGAFIWPTQGYITQGYWSLHRALDIGAGTGAPVYASDSGYVVFAGWDDTGYGNLVIIHHGNGFVTYYAHLSKILVSAGTSVTRGDKIGLVGSTGRSTGSHLHFEIWQRDVQRNPIGFLP
ncbi:MAG: peptidoglycan DD-metalloendopeptidase family protein [Anaerolineae bacterium]